MGRLERTKHFLLASWMLSQFQRQMRISVSFMTPQGASVCIAVRMRRQSYTSCTWGISNTTILTVSRRCTSRRSLLCWGARAQLWTPSSTATGMAFPGLPPCSLIPRQSKSQGYRRFCALRQAVQVTITCSWDFLRLSFNNPTSRLLCKVIIGIIDFTSINNNNLRSNVFIFHDFLFHLL